MAQSLASCCPTEASFADEPLRLESADGVHVPLDPKWCSGSHFLEQLLQCENDDAGATFLPSISGRELTAIADFLRRQHSHQEPLPAVIRKPLSSPQLAQNGVPTWAAEQVGSLSPAQLVDLANASNFLGLQALCELCAAQLGALLFRKTPSQIAEALREDIPLSLGGGRRNMAEEEEESDGLP